MAEKVAEVKEFSWDTPVLNELETVLSHDRLTKYTAAAEGDRKEALRVYAWNIAVSSAFYGPLQILEVAMRNAMHRELAAAYGDGWYDNDDAGLDKGCEARIARAKEDLRRDGHPSDPPQMVATLSFGFWVSLIGAGGRRVQGRPKANYEMTLWRPALRRAFPHAKSLSRKSAHEPLNHLRLLRNRIAHHEPIFERHLAKDYESILSTLGWISLPTRDWVSASARVNEILAVQSESGRIRF